MAATSVFSNRRRLVGFLAVSAALIVSATLADPWAYANVVNEGVYDHDWGRLLRVMGFLPLWFLAAAALWLTTTTQSGRRGAILLVAAPTLAGGVGELMKLLIRRERPNLTDGEYLFRSFDDRLFSSSGLGMPSTHVIVAFAAAAVLARLWPRASVIWYGLAAGCALTRVWTRAHFLSDVVVAAVVAYAIVALLWRRYGLPFDHRGEELRQAQDQWLG